MELSRIGKLSWSATCSRCDMSRLGTVPNQLTNRWRMQITKILTLSSFNHIARLGVMTLHYEDSPRTIQFTHEHRSGRPNEVSTPE